MRNLLLATLVVSVPLVACTCGTGVSPDGGAGGGGSAAAGGTGGGGGASSTAVNSVGTPAANQERNSLGNGISVALDAAGNPAVAFGSFDPNADSDHSDSVFAYSAWDAAAKKFKTPVVIDHPGDVRKLGLQLAIDNGTIAVAYAKDDAVTHLRSIWLATSTDGVTFTTTKVSSSTATSLSGWSAMALKSGVVHLAWNEDADVKYRTGSITNVAGLAAAVTVPVPAGNEVNSAGRLALALDAAGVPAVAFGLSDQQGHLGYAFWRPGLAMPKVLAATQRQNDDWGVVMAFAGTTARVVMNAAFASVPGDGLKATSSSDNGDTWSAPVEVPDDGGQLPNTRLALAVSASGKSAISYGVAGGNLTGTQCDQPKLARSIGFGPWSVCSPTHDTFDIDYPSMVFTPAEKLVIAFQNVSASAMPLGVVVYVEP